jgi:hypothetical protein
MKRWYYPKKKTDTLRDKMATLLVNLAYKIDPTSDAYKTYIMDKVCQTAVLGGVIKIEYIDPREMVGHREE